MDHSWKPSEMYESYFRFKDTPFRLSADEKFRFAHKNYLRASAHLAYALDQGEGFVMITGQPGSGKTTLIRDVISELDEGRYNTLNLVTSQLQAEELLRKVALEYGFPAENANKATLLTNIQKHLSKLHDEGKRSILFLDEAQNLSANGLEELRLLSNLQQGKHSLLQVVLVGHNELRKLILGPDMQHVQQRLIASCQIEPLALEQTREYILHRLKHVDWQSDPKIEEEVFHLIHTASQGVPRIINHLMSHLLLFACLEEKHNLTDEDALTVIEELVDQQRLTLPGEESIENFAKRYRAEKQQVIRQAAGNHSSVSLTPQEQDSWNHEAQNNSSTTQRIDTKSLKPVNDETAPVNDTNPKAPESEQSGARINHGLDPQPTLPDADDIWNGAMESKATDNFFPENRRHKSNFSAEPAPAKPQAATQPVGAEILKDPEVRWGGVWFMSSGNRHQGANRRNNTILFLKQDQNITVNENLSMPSVWVEDCPDIVATDPLISTHRHQKPAKGNALKRSFFHVFVLVFIGVLVMLAIKMYPDEFSRLLHILETGKSVLSQATTEDAAAPSLPEQTHQDNLPSQPPPVVANEGGGEMTSPAPGEDNSNVIQEVDSGNGRDEAVSNNVLPEPMQAEDQEIAAQSPLLQWVNAFETEPEESGTATTDESPPPEADNSDIASYHNIELATLYSIYFDFNKSTLTSTYEPLLKSIRDKMLLDENNYLKITGYADSQGNGNYNYSLSLKRAEAVKEYFTIRGIADDRLQVAAVGSVKRSDYRWETLDTRKRIRRVEVILFPR
jgi:type II secretory pathway predicted ATPase ExeA/outer membrane protein OmpA-like peptidoglycan-associated protein